MNMTCLAMVKNNRYLFVMLFLIPFSDSYIPAATCAQEAGIGYRTRGAVAANPRRSVTATANKKRELSPATLKKLRRPDPTLRSNQQVSFTVPANVYDTRNYDSARSYDSLIK